MYLLARTLFTLDGSGGATQQDVGDSGREADWCIHEGRVCKNDDDRNDLAMWVRDSPSLWRSGMCGTSQAVPIILREMDWWSDRLGL